ncbi:zinc finger protein 385C-like isoform X1 [Vanacampus margaritifer]
MNLESREAWAARVTEKEPQDEDKAKRLLYCSLCKVAVNSASQLRAHNSGAKHKTMLEAKSGDGTIESFPRVGVKKVKTPASEPAGGLRDRTFRCHICDVHVNSDTQLKQVLSPAAISNLRVRVSKWTSVVVVVLAAHQQPEAQGPSGGEKDQAQIQSVCARTAAAHLPACKLGPCMLIFSQIQEMLKLLLDGELSFLASCLKCSSAARL